MLQLQNISVESLNGKKILEEININVKENTITLILGPNGAGKSTIGEVILGSEEIKTKGKIKFGKKDITKLKIYQRAQLGIFLAHQTPTEIPGVKIIDFLYEAYKSIKKEKIDIWEFKESLEEKIKRLEMQKEILERNVNEGFSGGEKKKFEILQMLILKPKVVILDEIDSGLDIDTVQKIFGIVKEYKKENKTAIILISHNTKILENIKPDNVILIKEGKIKETGKINLAKKILKDGYTNKGI